MPKKVRKNDVGNMTTSDPNIDWEIIFNEENADLKSNGFREDDVEVMALLEEMFKDYVIIERKDEHGQVLGEEWVQLDKTTVSSSPEKTAVFANKENKVDASPSPHGNLKPEAHKLIYTPPNKNTAEKYSRYAQMYLDYVHCEERAKLLHEETTLCNFFHDALENKYF